jgi:signal transduction histidine kinase
MLAEIARFLGESFKADTCFLLVNTRMKAVIWSSQGLSIEEESLKQAILSSKWLEKLQNNSKPQTFTFENPSFIGLTLRNGLGMPTFFRDEQNGILVLGSQKQRKWTQKEKDNLENLAFSVALAYHLVPAPHSPSSPELDKETEENVRKLVPNQGSPIIRQLYELMRQQLTQQRQLNEFKDNIITAISDKARNPLASMQMAITLLKKNNLTDEQKQRSLGILEDEWQQLNVLINNIVILKQLETHELTVERQPYSIMSLIESITDPLVEKWQRNPRKSLTLKIEPISVPKTFYTDPKHLRTILDELLTNAGNYAAPETSIQVTVNTEETDVIIKIENQGCLLEDDEQTKIFDLFYRGKDAIAHAVPGTGIGLTLVKGLVELLEGKIQLISEPKTEEALTTVILTLPSLTP